MSQKITLNKVNFSRSVKKLTKLINGVDKNLTNNQTSDLLARSFGFSSYRHAKMLDFNIKSHNDENNYICVLNFCKYSSLNREKSKKIIVYKGFKKEELTLLFLMQKINERASVELKSDNAIKLFNQFIDEMNEKGFLGNEMKGKNEDVMLYEISDVLVDYLRHDTIKHAIEKYPSFNEKFEEILNLEIKENRGLDIEEEEEILTFLGLELKEINDETLKALEELNLLDEVEVKE